MKFNYKNVIDNRYIVAEDGFFSNPEFGEGRLLPAVVLKSRNGENKLQELILMHRRMPPGDVVIRWGKPSNILLRRNILYLQIEFVQPVELVLQIEFHIKDQYSLIDAIIESRGLILSMGEIGQKVSMKVEAGEIISIEVPDVGFDSDWNKILNKILKKKFKKHGVSKKQLKKIVKDHISHMRQILYLRRGVD